MSGNCQKYPNYYALNIINKQGTNGCSSHLTKWSIQVELAFFHSCCLLHRSESTRPDSSLETRGHLLTYSRYPFEESNQVTNNCNQVGLKYLGVVDIRLNRDGNSVLRNRWALLCDWRRCSCQRRLVSSRYQTSISMGQIAKVQIWASTSIISDNPLWDVCRPW